MKQLLNKCCQAERVADRYDNGMPIRLYCEECEGNDPIMEYVDIEMKDFTRLKGLLDANKEEIE